MAKQKYYVVWKGREAGVYTSWDECKKQIDGFAGAEYKSFETKELAEQAFGENSKKHIFKNANQKSSSDLSPLEKAKIGKPILESISVDAAWNTASGDMEYRGVNTKTKEQLFHQGPFKDGTNNIGEFLAIVHGLAYLQKLGSRLPIYSDSVNAIKWVQAKKHRTKLEPTDNNDKLFELLDRAEKWLAENTYPNPILKWETKVWGENPADFGRK
ncbi:ribonuclease H family protein [Cytophagaceae bacterium DM2B3-1]|uniref:Ribonuclease H n=1 Tax=Xanthocytophaga flava TaxID=3048013 RepID=A0AAE3U568_9BACT|nr:ribonuclease H family protein [Xanthocytophaga flavus]MDJ1466568.1 ribonuclease H family protein [Xanthocytophaga flavus]MDJ1479222.1 ribonuclease H family protein [Xanthocytophaga flavus]MDJ1492566.1 ribonuclease H family protein [Xanthocytophaga flavus]